MRIESETLIDAPWTSVFAVATDIRGWPDRIPGIVRVEVLTPGPIATGTRFRETRRLFGREAAAEMTVAELVAPERFVLTAENHGMRYRAEHILAEAGGRRTRLTLAFSGEPVRLSARLLAPIGWLMHRSVRRMLDADLAALKVACEANAPSPGVTVRRVAR